MIPEAAVLARRLAARARRDPVLRSLDRLAADAAAELWLVGGPVRDAALGRPTADLDLVVGRGAARLVRAVQDAWHTGGFRVRRRGVTTWRFSRDGRAVDVVVAAGRGLAGDLTRRDLTVNAIAWDVRSRTLRDPHRGLADLRAGRLRAPRAGAVAEDPVRALRVCRFLAALPGFRAVPTLRAEAAAAASGLARAPAERVRAELDKLLAAVDPPRGLDALARFGLRAAVLPELEPMAGCAAGAGRPDVWTHTLATLDWSARRRRLPGGAPALGPDDVRVLRWALLLHDVAKPDTLAVRVPDGRPTFHGHEVLGAERADAILRRLVAPRSERARVARIVRLHLRPGHLADAGPTRRGLARLVREAGPDLRLLVLHAACDARGSGGADPARWRRLRRVLLDLLELDRARAGPGSAPLVDGRDVMRALGIGPGPEVGRALARLRELQDAGELRSREDALAALRAPE